MDIFSLSKDGAYAPGRIIHGIDSVLWVERYDTAGTFKIVGDPTPTLLSDLALGTLITHTQTLDVMMVESHVIDETKEGSPKVEVSGRCLSAVMMENRVVTTSYRGLWFNDSLLYPLEFYAYSGNTWYHIIELISAYLQQSELPAENLPKFYCISEYVADEVPPKERVFKRLSLVSTAVYDMLKSIDAGLKVVRPNPNSFYYNHLGFVVHKGVDRSGTIRFDWNSGDLQKARYVWSDKEYRNSAYGGNDEATLRVSDPNATGFDRRTVPVDMSDWKEEQPPPTGGGWSDSKRKNFFRSRITEELAKRKRALIIDAEVSSSAKYDYGIDYNIGDRVFVIGRYGAEAVMRVVEHARAVDKENGESSFPTLAPIDQT